MKGVRWVDTNVSADILTSEMRCYSYEKQDASNIHRPWFADERN